MSVGQEEVVAFLADSASYPGGGPVERLETHANLVFLAGDHAWKIKRAVRLPYLDFSSLEKRHRACAREVEVNRLFAPELDLGYVPIVRSTTTGSLAFGGEGEVVEWAVHMRRFDQSALLSHVAATGDIEAELAKSVADAVLESHRHAKSAVSNDGSGPFKAILAALSRSLTVAAAFPGDAAQSFLSDAGRHLALAGEILDERARHGYVRRCHGDIHLANIALWQGRPLLYDAIEFDEAIATIDTLYDLAFLLMDLEHHQQRRAACIAFNHYLWRSQEDLDLAGLRALPLFLALRAAVRAVVSVDRAEQQKGEVSSTARQEADRYLQLAHSLLAPQQARLVVIAGISGTGKTTLAAALAPNLGSAPGAVHLRSDLERKALFHLDETVPLDPGGYSAEVNRKVYAALRRKARTVLRAGHSVVIDAVYPRAEERRVIEDVAAELRVPFRGIWLQAAPDKLIARVSARRGDASDANAGIVQRQLAGDFGPLSGPWHVLDTNGSKEEICIRASGILEIDAAS
jgi:aminoglycoside phosphotransferase family enzyme/predicted kinase